MSSPARKKSASSLVLGTITVAAIVWWLVYFAADSLIRVERRTGPTINVECRRWQ